MAKKQIYCLLLLNLLLFNTFSFPMKLAEENQKRNTSNHSFNVWFKEIMGPPLLESIHELKVIINVIENTQTDIEYLRLLLDGPPGTAKSIIAETFAKKLGKKIKFVRPYAAKTNDDMVLKRYVANEIRPVFKGNGLKEPYAIIIKKIDQLNAFSKESGIVPALAVTGYMDRAERENSSNYQDITTKPVPRVIFLATTNERWDYIKDTIRSRSMYIKVNYPDDDLRATILSKYFTSREGINTRNCNNDLFIESLAKRTKDFSVKNLKEIFILAEKIAAEEQEEQEFITLQQIHVLKAYEDIWQKTAVSKKSWPRIGNSWIRNVTKKYSPNILLATIVTGFFYKCCRLKRSISFYNTAYFSPLYSYPASIASSIKKFILYCHQSISKKSRADKLE